MNQQIKKEVNNMEKVYADLIRKGVKTIDDVPKKIRDKVRKIIDQ